MRKTLLVGAVLLMQMISVGALTSGEAKQDWLDKMQLRIQANAAYRQAELDYAANHTPENENATIVAVKALFGSALDEAEAWLVWKNIEAHETDGLPEDLQQTIQADVDANLAKIAVLRTEVAGISTRFEAGVMWLKMIGKYVELLTDAARDTGSVFVHVGNTRLDTADSYEAQLRAAALQLDDNADILAKLDVAKSELELARAKVGTAEASYGQVRLPGTPFIKFAEGNAYMVQARTNLLNAHAQLALAYNLIIARGG